MVTAPHFFSITITYITEPHSIDTSTVPFPSLILTAPHSAHISIVHFTSQHLYLPDGFHHSQLLNIIILKFNSPVLLNLLGNIFPYCPAVGAIRRVNSCNIDLQEGQCWICNWECLYCDSSRDIQWNIAWALGKSVGLSLGLRLYFIVYPSSCHNKDSVLGRAQLPASLHSTSQHLVCQPVVQHWGSCPVSSHLFLWLVARFSWAKVFHWASEI